MEYAIIIPAKNEESNIENALLSILSQSYLPIAIVVVDDDSTDKTPDIIKKYASKNHFIYHIKRAGEKKYQLGGHVIQLFNIGKNYLDKKGIKYDYIVKMDADLEFENDFIEKISPFLQSGEWGILSGTPYYIENGGKVYDRSPMFHSRGQFKFYNKKCLEQIGGIPIGLGWDTADNIKAMQKGWKTGRIDEIDYKMQRKIGGKHSLLKGRKRHGIGTYNLRYNILYFFIKSIHDLFKPPIILGSIFVVYSYILCFFNKKNKRILTKEEAKTLNKLLWQEFKSRFKKRDFYLLQKLSKKH